MVQDPRGFGKSTKTGKLIEGGIEKWPLLGEDIGSLFIPSELAQGTCLCQAPEVTWERKKARFLCRGPGTHKPHSN